MLRSYIEEFHIELLSLSQDVERIAQCFFRDDEARKYTPNKASSPNTFQIESTLAALAEECRQIPVLDVIFLYGPSDSKSRWRRLLQKPASFARSVAELSFQLQDKASNHWLIVISRDFEALVLVESLRIALESKKCRPLDSHIIATIFLEAPDFGHPTLSRSPLVHSERYRKLWGEDLLSRRIARSVWKFQRQRRSFQRIGISKKSERSLCQISVQLYFPRLKDLIMTTKLQNGFDPSSWKDAPPTRMATFTYVSCDLEEMSDCLIWTIWRSMKGHQKLQRVLKPANMLCHLPTCSEFLFCKSPLSYLERLLRTRSPERRRTLLKVLRWVAYSLRPLEVHELLVAVSTATELDKFTPDDEASNTEPCIGTQEDLLAFCDGLLGRSDEGTIRFVHESVRDFVKSPAMRSLDTWEERQVHERMAAVCLRHVACVDETAVVRPWAQAAKQVRDRTNRCHLRDYSALHWHQHFRLAEPTSMYLPSLLYRMLQGAFQKLDSESGIAEGILTVERRIDEGLDFCCRHDFLKVGKMFLEMGAKTKISGISSAHIAAASGSTNLLQHLLSSQFRPDYYAELFEGRWLRGAYSPIELAAFHGRTTAVELLLRVKSSITCISDSDLASAYAIAAEYGHKEVVRTFVKCAKYPRHTQEADCQALRLAKELEHDDIVELISTSRSMSHSNLNPHDPSVCQSCSPAVLTDSGSPQERIAPTLEPQLQNLDLDQDDVAYVEADICGSDEFEGWSLVEYPDINPLAEVHMDLDNG